MRLRVTPTPSITPTYTPTMTPSQSICCFNIGTGFNITIRDIQIQSDGKILVGGDFTSYNGSARNRIIRLNNSGGIDSSFNIGTGFNGGIFSIEIQNDGKILLVGAFTSYNGNNYTCIIRLNDDGTVDNTFSIGTGFNSSPTKIKIQSDGKIIAVGNFISYNGIATSGIIRLNNDGSVDTSFVYGTGFANTIGFGAIVRDVRIQSDGKIIAVGTFTSYNGTAANRIIRLNTDGSVDTSFVSGTGFAHLGSQANGNFSCYLQSDQKILVSGFFSGYNSTNINSIVRLNTNGSVDTSFVVGSGLSFGGAALDFYEQIDGKIIAVGTFTSYNGTAANRIIRLNNDGSIDTSFVYGSGFNNSVYSIILSSDGKLLVGGGFISYNGTLANRIIRLNTDGSLDNCLPPPSPTPTPTNTVTPTVTPTSTPDNTPTPTPTVTPTISVTPTITPTISVTPSMSYTGITGTITIENNTTTSSSMTDVSPGFYVVGSGSFPLLNGQGLTGTHGGYTGLISITIGTAASGGGKIRVYVNAGLASCMDVTMAGIYTTGSITIASGDIVLIEYVDGSC